MAIDIILVLVTVYGFWIGYSRGIIATVFTALSYGFGIIAAMRFAPSVTRLLEEQIHATPLMFIAGFLLTFLGTMMILRLIGRSLEGVLKSVNINIVNQVLGGTFSAAIMILVFSVILMFSQASGLVGQKTIDTSMSYIYVKEFPSQIKVVYEKGKPIFLTFWEESTEFMDRIEEMTEKEDGNPNIFDIDEEKSENTSN